MREREEERVRMAPNMGAGGSHPQATSDPGEGEMAEGNEEKEEILKLLRGWEEKKTSPIVRWALADESTEEESNQENGEEKKETQGMKWADCEDDEGEKNKEEQEQEEAESKKEQEAERKQEQEGDRKKEAEEKKEQGEEQGKWK